MKTQPQYPPTPKTRLPGNYDLALKFARQATILLAEMAQTYGDIIHYEVGSRHIYQFNHPDQIKEVLVTQQHNFEKGISADFLRQLLGEGLLISRGTSHLQHRRLLQPAFHRKMLTDFGQIMVDYSQQQSNQWQNGALVDMGDQMKAITLAVVTKTLFSLELTNQAELTQALQVLEAWTHRALLPPRLGNLLCKLPLPLTRRFNRAIRYINNHLYKTLEERRANSDPDAAQVDVMTLLLQNHDEEKQNGGLTDTQIRDQLITFFIAGHETTSTALTWAWYLLAQHPEVETQLHEELDRVLGGRLPGVDDLPKLPYTQKVFKEVLRLYPSAFVINRKVIKECVVGNYTLPADALVFISPYVIQRDPRYFADPNSFRPERWTTEFEASLSKYAYLPFGMGIRRCIGEDFAKMEGVLVLATLAQQWQAQLMPGFKIKQKPKLVLLPNAMPMLLRKRG